MNVFINPPEKNVCSHAEGQNIKQVLYGMCYIIVYDFICVVKIWNAS